LTNCLFEQTSDSDVGIESRWLSVYGTKNRIDHCYFGGKKNRGSTLVVWVAGAVERHRIDHNLFGPRPELGRNGGETIRIGTSDVSELDCRTIVEDNYFHECNGEAEIISNKSCENIYRHNVFDACSGALTLRHGHRCLVDGNVFLGRKKRGTGGVRIIGQEHTVTNNYFEGLRGDAERAAICLMNGVPNGSLNGYAPVRKAIVSHNTFIDCKVTIEIGVGAGESQSAAPVDCRIAHNAFLPDKWPLFRVHAKPAQFVWKANKHQAGRFHEDQLVRFERVDLRFERAADGLVRPTTTESLRTTVASPVRRDLDGNARGDTPLAGCDDPTNLHRQLPSVRNTGPTWRVRAAGEPSAKPRQSEVRKGLQ
jgi:poly(beta-D-mannuronate) lyase